MITRNVEDGLVIGCRPYDFVPQGKTEKIEGVTVTLLDNEEKIQLGFPKGTSFAIQSRLSFRCDLRQADKEGKLWKWSPVLDSVERV